MMSLLIFKKRRNGRLKYKINFVIIYLLFARVVKLVDAMDSKSIGTCTMPVRVRPRAPNGRHSFEFL